MERLVDFYIRAGPLKSSRLWNHSMHTIERQNQKEFALGVFLDIDGSFDNDNASFGAMDAASGERRAWGCSNLA
jgi:hypothetical protein